MELKGLKFLRKSFGMTMKELGEKLDVSPTTINLWEKGQMPITQERLYELNNFFMLDNPNILYHDFNKESMETSNFILEVELARLQYKIKQHNELYSHKVNSEQLLSKIDMVEENKELYENLLDSLNELLGKLSPTEFKDMGTDLNYIISGLASKDKRIASYFKLWIDIIRFNGLSKYGNNNYNRYSVEDYIKTEVRKKIETLQDMIVWNEDEEYFKRQEEKLDLDEFNLDEFI